VDSSLHSLDSSFHSKGLPPCDRGAQQSDAAARASGQAPVEAESARDANQFRLAKRPRSASVFLSILPESTFLSIQLPPMATASKRGQLNNGKSRRAARTRARSRSESASSAKHERACQLNKERPAGSLPRRILSTRLATCRYASKGGHPPHHSSTSSARPNSHSGNVTPSALAALRLMTSSTLADCWTGRSAGASPLRMRPA
jgi:hypothetical protein